MVFTITCKNRMPSFVMNGRGPLLLSDLAMTVIKDVPILGSVEDEHTYISCVHVCMNDEKHAMVSFTNRYVMSVSQCTWLPGLAYRVKMASLYIKGLVDRTHTRRPCCCHFEGSLLLDLAIIGPFVVQLSLCSLLRH